MRLYNSAGTQLGLSQASGTTAESITYNSSGTSATYYVQVYGYNGANSSTACYLLRAATSGINLLDDEEIVDSHGLIAKTEPSAEASLFLQPMPASSYTNLVFSSKFSGRASITVSDIAGVPVKKIAIAAIIGMNRYQLDVSNLKNGTYLVQLKDDSGLQKVQKLIVQH